jgi:hypothetical protein
LSGLLFSRIDRALINRFLEQVNYDISSCDFIGLGFVTALEDMARDIALIEPDPVDW